MLAVGRAALAASGVSSSRTLFDSAYRWRVLRLASLQRQRNIPVQKARTLQTEALNEQIVPFGKQLKDDFKRKRNEKQLAKSQGPTEEQIARLARWDLTVGLEIHAQLNTDRKLFSTSKTSIDDTPNTNVSYFDLAFPGSQPVFQVATLIPALRAAFALNCSIQHESRFDRKHYFYQDQPSGYQITQFYKPFAIDGHINLFEQDGIESSDTPIVVGIKQVQMEQDTGKSIVQPPSNALVDFNRVGHPLIEIITLPDIHSPQTAAACARKIQSILQTVSALHTGMEMGGLRADVNVSVSPKGSSQLGQRTEIKNLSSFKGVEQAIIAERDRQIELLERGGRIAGETRGWTLGDTHTTKLRGKEGEVDYRYMPDPDILPVLIDHQLTEHIRNTLPSLPDEIAKDLVEKSGLTLKDARTLVALDDGQRLDYFDDVCALFKADLTRDMSKMLGNWVIHELGGLLSGSGVPFTPALVPADCLASILLYLRDKKITGTSAKRLFSMVFESSRRDIDNIVEEEGMLIQHLSDDDYHDMAKSLVKGHPDKVRQIQKGQFGKIKFLVGQMMRTGEGNVEAVKLDAALRRVMGVQEDTKE